MIDAPLKFACRGCGASLDYSSNDKALKCQYCASITEIPKEVVGEVPNAAKTIIPLTVDVTALTDAVYEHLASGDLTPDHLLEHATFSKKERFYVPAYAFTGSFEAEWTASFGYDRQEHYTAYETRTQNGHSRQVPVTRTKTVTDWRPVNGTDSGRFAVLAYAGKRLFDTPLGVVSLVENKSASDATRFDPSYTAGIPIEEFNALEDDAYRARAWPQIETVINNSVQRHGQGDHQRDWHWTTSTRKQSTTMLLPVCHAVYEFEGQQYNVWVSGSDAGRIVADALPIDASRKLAIRLGFLPFAIAFASASVAVFKFDSAWTIPAVVATAAVLFGALRRAAIIGHSRKLRQSLLAARQAASTNTARMTPDEQQALIVSVKRPGKPWLANSALDMLIIPVLSLVVGLTPLVTHLAPTGGSNSFAESQAAAPALQRVAATVTSPPALPGRPAAAPAPSRYPACAGSVELHICEEREARLASETPEQRASRQASLQAEQSASMSVVNGTAATTVESEKSGQSGPTTQVPSSNGSQLAEATFVPNALRLSKENNWNAVDELVNLRKEQVVAAQQGDRKYARAANNEGLAALKSNDYPAAVVAFERGVVADASDIEIRNNLGFALLKAGRNEEALKVLASILFQVPDRSSAWANLAEASASDSDKGTAALKLAVRFSASRERTLDYLKQVSEGHANPQFQAIAASVLTDLGPIPRSAADHG